MANLLQSLRYTRGKLSVIDQLKLPHELEYIDVVSTQDAWNVIRTMQVRGAPLIAIVAALGLAVDVHAKQSQFTSASEAAKFLTESMVHLRTSRPTAVNLFRATDALTNLVNQLEGASGATSESVVTGYIEAAEKMLADDVATNKAIGDFGAKRILEITGRDSIRVLTICNTGSLATAGYGTALGVVRSLHAMGKLEHVYACETRPYNQGARLTAFEIVHDGMPGTLIGDSMASALMAVKGVDVVIVGADRVTANGDTANKIGTYQLAIVAKHHGVPFFAAVPTTTLDLTMSNGTQIFVEERPAEELTSIFGQKIAPDGVKVWNPSFDVTPSSLIRGIITEVGVAEADPHSTLGTSAIDMPAFLASKGVVLDGSTVDKVASIAAAVPFGYKRMGEADIAKYIADMPKMAAMLGVPTGEEGAKAIHVAEVGDGNLNFVYILTGTSKTKIVVKQALPYVRCVGESWPLTLDRATFEANALKEEYALAPTFVPELYHFDKSKALIVMRYVEEPHIILRKAFIQGLRFSTFADHLSTFMANTLFGTSSLAMDSGSFRKKVSEWSQNTAMCSLTEQVVFTDPYATPVPSINRWTSPHLDDFAQFLRDHAPLKIAIAALKAKFVGSTEALIHADLHSGSVMAKEGSTYVIDPEFAFYGPMGFDVGALLANLLLAYFSQGGLNGADYADWLMTQTIALFGAFETKFLALWNSAVASGKNGGSIFKDEMFSGSSLQDAQKRYMQSLWQDSIGFAGAKMIRRIVGIAHVADLETISDLDVRAACEKRCLCLAARMVMSSQGKGQSAGEGIENIQKLADMARGFYNAPPPQTLF